MAATFALSLSIRASDITRCDQVFEEVRTSVQSEPQKILIIVEDAMVANETCACEIVKAAILGAKADAELTKQIVLAATHIAPQMGPLIADCAGAVTPGGGNDVVETVKQELGIQPDEDQPTGEGGSDYTLIPGDIRGVYLIQPSTGGGGFSTTQPSTEKSTSSTKVVVKHLPPSHSAPQSPSVAQGP